MAAAIGLALATEACTGVAQAPAKPTQMASPRATGSPSPSASATASAASAPSFAILVAFPNGTGPQSTGYDLALVGTAGNVVARVHAATRAFIHQQGIGAPAATDLPEISASSSRVYYLDGDSDVRYLHPDGSSGHVTTLSGTKTVHAGFAVTPDDRRIAVSLLDYAASPPVMRLYVEDLRGGANHTEIFSSRSSFVWPVGWHGGKLVLAAVGGPPFSPQGIAWNPYSAPEYHVVDPSDATRLATIGSGDFQTGCQPSGLLTAAGTACYHRTASSGGAGYFSTLDWNETQGSLRVTTDTWGIAGITPSGGFLAGCCDPGGAAWIASPDSRFQSHLHSSGQDWPCFIDDANLLFGFLSPAPNQHAQMVNARRNMDGMVPIQVPATAFCAGILPAALDYLKCLRTGCDA